MELRHLRYFTVLAEELHFGRAARRLSISQPPLSVAIRQLEESVGAQLFERNSKAVRLTAAGGTLQASARALLRDADEALLEARHVAQGSAGRLRIGFVGAMLYRGLPQALTRFQAAHPAVRVTLAELNSGEQMAELLHDRLDVGFVHTRRVPAELECRLLVSEPFVACLPARHALAKKRKIPLASLRGESFVLFSRSASPDYHERILSICADAGFWPEVRQEVRHWLAVVSLVSQGMGVALVPDAMRHCALPGAVFLPLEGASTPSEAYGVWLSASRNVLVTRLLDEAAHGLEQRRRSPTPSQGSGAQQGGRRSQGPLAG